MQESFLAHLKAAARLPVELAKQETERQAEEEHLLNFDKYSQAQRAEGKELPSARDYLER